VTAVPFGPAPASRLAAHRLPSILVRLAAEPFRGWPATYPR
jgi:hypothetical protein